MADEEKEGTEQEAAETPPASDPKAKKKIIIIAASIAGVVLLVAIVLYFIFSGETALDRDAAKHDPNGPVILLEDGSDIEEELLENEVALGAMFPLETFVVNLSGGGFIRVQMQLEFISRNVPKRFMNKLVPVRDALIALLSNKRRSDLLNREGKEDLKSEIIAVINELLGKQEIRNVYFTNFVIQ